MDHQPAIAQALENAPPSLILGLVTRDPRLRERSLERLADEALPVMIVPRLPLRPPTPLPYAAR